MTLRLSSHRSDIFAEVMNDVEQSKYQVRVPQLTNKKLLS